MLSMKDRFKQFFIVLILLNIQFLIAQERIDCINEYNMIYEDCEVYFGYEGDVNAIIIGHPAECKKPN